MIFMITLILIITMIVDWLVIIWRWTWVVIMIMPIDSRCSLLIDYDEKHDWWFSDDNWSWLMNDDKGRVPTQPGKREKSVKLNIALPALEKSLN